MIYALGGGWGHLVRAIALGKVLKNYGKVHILTNSIYYDRVVPFYPDLTVHLVPNLSPQLLAHSYKQLLDEHQINCLIVDTFPRGIVGELVEVLTTTTITKILTARDLNPCYVHQYDLEKFIRASYDLCIPIEPVEFSESVSIDHPITICNSAEILTPTLAQTILQINNYHCKTILICPSGNPPEMQLFQSLYGELQELLPADNVCLADYFPAMKLYSAVDLVIGSGGYNTVGECLALNLPLLGLPFVRRYDRQALRLQRYKTRGIHLIENKLDILAKIKEIIHNTPPKSGSINFRNGANEFVDRLVN